MNKKIGAAGALVDLLAVLGFAVCMLLDFDSGSYFWSMFIAFGFVIMMCGFLYFAAPERRTAGYAAAAFSAVYAAIILVVYFTQLTTVRLTELTEQACELLDFQQMGLFFSLDLLGYALMSLATFFAGLTVEPKDKPSKWLRALLMIHGVFFISCLIMPMLGVFQADSPAWIGVAVLEFWCAYFCPIAVLAFHYFRGQTEQK